MWQLKSDDEPAPEWLYDEHVQPFWDEIEDADVYFYPRELGDSQVWALTQFGLFVEDDE